MKLLTEEKVSQYMSLLNQAQREFLENHIKQSKKSKWLEVLAKRKGISIELVMDMEALDAKIADWVLVDVLDGGFGKRPYRCECGQRIRFQYIVFHKEKNEKLKLGSTCFENYTHLSKEIVKDIKAGLHSIDLERDEILIKFRQGERSDFLLYGDMEIPDLMQKQVALGLPLSQRQVNQLDQLWEQTLKERRRKAELQRRASVYQSMTPMQRQIVDTLTEKEKDEILTKIIHDHEVVSLAFVPFSVPEKISCHAEAGLPLLDRQQETMDKLWQEYRQQQQLELERKQREREHQRKMAIAKQREEAFQTLTKEQQAFVDKFDDTEREQVLDLVKKGNGDVPAETISKLDISPDIKDQVGLGLPLLPYQEDIILKAQLKRRQLTGGITYEELIVKHIQTLKAVREKEERIPGGLRGDWVQIQQMVKDLKEEKEINYSKFKTLLSNLIIPLRVEKDKYM